jgi:hypothetical protein
MPALADLVGRRQKYGDARPGSLIDSADADSFHSAACLSLGHYAHNAHKGNYDK